MRLVNLKSACNSGQLTSKIVAEDRRGEDVHPGACVQVNRTPISSLIVFEDTLAKYRLFIFCSNDICGTAERAFI